MLFIKTYLLTLINLITIDAIWLGWIAKNFYHGKLGFLLTDQPIFASILSFYLIYAMGITYFVIYPSMKRIFPKMLITLFFKGAFFGLICYATYDLTNFATIAKWPIEVVWIDLSWGSFLTGFVSMLSFLLSKKRSNTNHQK